MRNNVETLKRLHENLEQARDDLEAINTEETLLEWEPTQFPQLNAMFIQKEPYDKLWNTALAFHNRSDEWLNGKHTLPLTQFNTRIITDKWHLKPVPF